LFITGDILFISCHEENAHVVNPHKVSIEDYLNIVRIADILLKNNIYPIIGLIPPVNFY